VNLAAEQFLKGLDINYATQMGRKGVWHVVTPGHKGKV
jgi:hypothetical protein